jgi:hypothetical protein
MTDAVFNLDRFKSKRQPATAAPSSPTAQVTPTKRLWAKVSLDAVLDRRQDETFSAPTRLLVYLFVKSHDGKRVVPLTNAMAAEVGLDRVRKLKVLRHLEAHGYVTVERHGQETPRVTLPPRGL